MIIEGIIIGGVIVLLGGLGALTVTVYRMSGVIAVLAAKVNALEARLEECCGH